ncbi:Metallo-dependent phosphatase [Mytilinidion resinicola]|uniref:Metallo-dependent phosphatase n=1 Tax=Mytilinidion resinicola TaxID=574789 RepID=A0A6A6YAV0_9PEZI|nr:Metallo-dependent phosphatase [Mytilinidion resinicola]KAF2805134.1 Metallo-dependent phosphatase [Mytilinidion resinicola]
MASSPPPRPQMRKTRFVCISDTHNQTPKLPRGDVLIHAGDLTNQGSLSELQKTVAWLEKADFEAKIIIAGNHDITLDAPFYDAHGTSWRFPSPQDPAACLGLLTTNASPSLTYLQHQPASIRLRAPTGPHTRFTVFGSPYSPTLGQWAFQYADATAAELWAAIPTDADVVVTHTPPRNHCDAAGAGRSHGCEALRRRLGRVRPRLVVCGHIHEGRGAERVRWAGDDDGEDGWLEEGCEVWEDAGAGSKRQSLVDLTGRGEGKGKGKGWRGLGDDGAETRHGMGSLGLGGRSKGGGEAGGVGVRREEGEERGRETCVVNAAFMAAGYGEGPKRFNKPIVVDMDLPIWTDGDDGEG